MAVFKAIQACEKYICAEGCKYFIKYNACTVSYEANILTGF
jgi:hypothetical protein